MDREPPMTAPTISPALPHERAAALRLVFADAGDGAVRNSLDLMATGRVDAAGLWVSRDGRGVVAAVLAALLPGRGAVVWPPACRSSAAPDFHELMTALNQWLSDQGVRLAQCLLPTGYAARAEPLTRRGFHYVTRLTDLHHYLDIPADDLGRRERLEYVSYAECDETEFEALLDRTYVGTLDCPEINGVRPAADAIAGYQGGDDFDAERWWLVRHRGTAVGVVLTAATSPGAWELLYFGVVPEHRGHGFGREIVRKILFEAKASGAVELSLAVDYRNEPARQIYRRAGFDEGESREVYLAVFGGT